jgi:hypothetical protein
MNAVLPENGFGNRAPRQARSHPAGSRSQVRGQTVSTAASTVIGPIRSTQAEFFRLNSQAGLPSRVSWQQGHFVGDPLTGSMQRGQFGRRKSKKPGEE